MKKKFIYKTLLILTLILTFSCGIRNSNYDREKIIKKYSSEYDIYVDSEKVKFENLYLAKDNIEKTIIDRKAKRIQINQTKTPEYITLNKIYLDSLSNSQKDWSKKEIGFIIINGILLNDKTMGDIILDPNSIKDFRIQKGEDSKDSRIFRIDRDYLIITTK